MVRTFLKSLANRVELVCRVLLSNDETVDCLRNVHVSSGLALVASGVEPLDEPLRVNQDSSLTACDEGFAIGDSDAGIETAEATTAAVDLISDLGREITERINSNLHDARLKTEEAVISVCNQVSRLVDIAREGNAEAQGTLRAIVGGPTSFALDEQETSIAEVIQTQAESVNEFVDETRRFFHQQIEAANLATASCREMQLCVAQVVKLVFSSEILAYNIQIESARLGDQGRAFSVLGDEMVRFSSKVRDANIAIQKSLNQVNASMSNFQEESKNMDLRLEDFTQQLQNRMQDVEHRTHSLTDSLHLTLDRITTRNQEVIQCSQTALSELQFQDPLAQSLLRTEYDVSKLQQLIETGSCDSLESVSHDPTIGRGEMHDREPGLVELF